MKQRDDLPAEYDVQYRDGRQVSNVSTDVKSLRKFFSSHRAEIEWLLADIGETSYLYIEGKWGVERI